MLRACLKDGTPIDDENENTKWMNGVQLAIDTPILSNVYLRLVLTLGRSLRNFPSCDVERWQQAQLLASGQFR